MIARRQRRWCGSALLRCGFAACAMSCAALPAWAQDKIPSVLQRPAADANDEPEAKEANDGPAMNLEMSPEQWADMAYSNLGGTRVNFEQTLRRRVRKSLNRTEMLCRISEALRDKVTATADLEFQRLDAEITALVAEAPRRPTQEQYQQFFNRLWKTIEPYRQAVVFGPGGETVRAQTLWEKVLHSNLSEDQREIVDSDQRRRSEFRSQVFRLETLMKIARVLGLETRQIRELESQADANPNAWISLDSAWATLVALPDDQKRSLFTESQRSRLTRPLEFSNDLQPVMNWDNSE